MHLLQQRLSDKERRESSLISYARNNFDSSVLRDFNFFLNNLDSNSAVDYSSLPDTEVRPENLHQMPGFTTNHSKSVHKFNDGEDFDDVSTNNSFVGSKSGKKMDRKSKKDYKS
jgi:hypothetical protein